MRSATQMYTPAAVAAVAAAVPPPAAAPAAGVLEKYACPDLDAADLLC
jgi:hypothetical protein